MATYEIIGYRQATPAEIALERKVEVMAEGQLSSVRRAAESWRNGAGVATSISVAGSLLAAPDVLAEANYLARTDGGWLLLIAAALSVMSLTFAMRASFGWPSTTDISSRAMLKSWQEKELFWSILFLRTSLAAALLALIAIVGAVSVLLFKVDLFFHFPGV